MTLKELNELNQVLKQEMYMYSPVIPSLRCGDNGAPISDTADSVQNKKI